MRERLTLAGLCLFCLSVTGLNAPISGATARPTARPVKQEVAAAQPPESLPKALRVAHQSYPALAPHINQGCERVGLRVHLTPRGSYQGSLKVTGEEGITSDLKWLSRHVQAANRLFAQLGVCFEVSELLAHPKEDARMRSRAQRTALGEKGMYQRGVIELFIVDRLDDVDVPDAYIRGVHWRHPEDREGHRWVILSRVARPLVLPHELGHYFSLPHGKDPFSIMNKTPRSTPPYQERGFTRTEYKKMRRAWRRMTTSKHLVPLTAKRPPLHKKRSL